MTRKKKDLQGKNLIEDTMAPPQTLDAWEMEQLVNGEPVERPMQVFVDKESLGLYRVPLELLKRHEEARNVRQHNVDLIKNSIRTCGKEDTDYPVTVALTEAPVNESWPFLDASGQPIIAVIIRGQHRVLAMRQLARDGKYENTWQANVLGPGTRVTAASGM